MATALSKWPHWMPPLVVDNYAVEPLDRRITSDMEIGQVSRVEFDTDETVATCSLWVNALQAKWLVGFERDYLRQGTRWFTLPIWTGGELLDHGGRFRERPKLAEKVGEYATYTFSLSVQKREGLFTPDITELLLHVSPTEIPTIDDILQTLVNVSWPSALPYQG